MQHYAMIGMALLALTAARGPLEPVPYVGAPEPYFLGTGIAGGGGDTHGAWDFLIGPDYTSPNFIARETLEVAIDGRRYPIAVDIHRARGSGIFFGQSHVGGLQVAVADYATRGRPWIARLVRVENRGAQSHVVQVMAAVTPSGARGASSSLAKGVALAITMGTEAVDFGGETKNWAPRTALIGFVDPAEATSGALAMLAAKKQTLAPGRTYSTALVHWVTYGPAIDLDHIRRLRPEADLTACGGEWARWMRGGRIPRIPDARAADAVEGSLVACRMEQDRDGGTIAGPRRYANSYVRDTHGAVGLFLAAGHVAEAEAAVATIDHRWRVAGFIPNYWSMGSDAFIGRSFRNDASEIPGYYALMLRDVYAATRDRRFVDRYAKSLRYAIDAQLDFMASHGWRIDFNGDETEQYCCRHDGETYGGFPAFAGWKSDAWSFPSAALAAASTQFYVAYLEAEGRSGEAAEYRQALRHVLDAIDATFLRHDVHTWARYKDGAWPDTTIPNYLLLPLWAGARLNADRQLSDARAAAAFERADRMLPTVPGVVDGFCGHNLGYLLDDLVTLRDPRAAHALAALLGTLGCWGTASEFYGPHGVPNGHNFRVFESGIDAAAIIRFYAARQSPPAAR